ncbi:MAG: Na+/Ca+ antiporter, CaCA family [Bacteroidetes bacterium]|nr:Na+/Ca+ antiporter, CaCA family [Bacteroidota bacterium]
MILDVILIILGFTLLIKGADWLVDGSSALAKKHNISDLVIGLTIVAFGTSAPEMVVNIIASFDKHSDIVYGNIVGSNNINLFFILGIVAIIFPISVKSSMVRKEIPISFIVALLVMLLSNAILGQKENLLSRWDAAILFALFLVFLYFTFRQTNKDDIPVQEPGDIKKLSTVKIWGLIIAGLASLIAGGRLVVNSAIAIAQDFGISEKIIALTIVAAGTSLPELVTSVVAASKRNSDIAIGNVIGSNIFNILFILSVSGIIHPIAFNTNFNAELLLLLGGTLLLTIFMFTSKKMKIDRWEGIVLLTIFIAYTIFMINKDI